MTVFDVELWEMVSDFTAQKNTCAKPLHLADSKPVSEVLNSE